MPSLTDLVRRGNLLHEAAGATDLTPAAGQSPREGYLVTSDSARLFYRIAGRAGPGVDTIIAIHGGPGLDLESIYNDFAPALGEKHVVIFYDQRGGGTGSTARSAPR